MFWLDEKEEDKEYEWLEDNHVMTVREWMASMMVMIVPLLNIVMLLCWAFGDKTTTPANKVNWARGTLLVLAAVLFSCAVLFGLYLIGLYIETK